ncbi:MAG: hypothetical protein LIP77_03985 [Planctomycetes bacterium]|nr:hypothetical protein [Planctomycetota bacterium]
MIEQMTHVAVISGAADKDALLDWLYAERGFHVMPISESEEAWQERFQQLPDESQRIDAELTKIHAVVAFCQDHASHKPGFLDAMLPLKVVGTDEDLEEALREVSIDSLADQTAAMRTDIESTNDTIARLRARKAAIEQFAFLDEDLPRLGHLKNLVLEVVSVSGQGGKAFLLDERIQNGDIVADLLFGDQSHSYYALVAPTSKAEELKALIDDHGLHLYPLPVVEHGATRELAQLDVEILDANARLTAANAKATTFADEWRKKASLVAGKVESDRGLALARTGMSNSAHLFVARGYLKTDALHTFKHRLETAVPGATVIPCGAPEGEEPPISLKWSRWVSPASLLVKMYGLPSYQGIDPTPFVATIFFAFVGICLGDAAYGIALILIMSWLKKRYADQRGLQDFFQCFVYCGIASIVFGALTGSWMGNLSAMIPGMGWFDKFRTSIQLIDPIKDSQLALYIAIGIGVCTQIYGMALRVYRDRNRGDNMGAFSDGILWIAFLVFAILIGLTGSTIAWALFIVTCIALVGTQGRDQKSIVGKFLVGLVSLYGIVGGYGASAILGDLISFARLMALALTGAALGSTFNMLAGLGAKIPYAGLILAVGVVIGGHLMNFFLNLLGGFVHSARLIMLEFFGRFYEAGGYAYKPYGFDSSTVDIVRKKQ